MKLTGCTDSVAHNFFISHILFHQVCFFLFDFSSNFIGTRDFYWNLRIQQGRA